jgi:hypothetical protein
MKQSGLQEDLLTPSVAREHRLPWLDVVELPVSSSEKNAKLAQKLGKLQPIVAVFPQEYNHGPTSIFWVNLTPCSLQCRVGGGDTSVDGAVPGWNVWCDSPWAVLRSVSFPYPLYISLATLHRKQGWEQQSMALAPAARCDGVACVPMHCPALFEGDACPAEAGGARQ